MTLCLVEGAYAKQGRAHSRRLHPSEAARLDNACAEHGKAAGCLPVFLKPYWAKEPAWSCIGPNVSVPTVATNELGMVAVVRPTAACKDIWNPYITTAEVEATRAIPISTDPAWQAQVHSLTQAVGTWLAEIDPNATRVRVVHFAEPAMPSLQMRPGPMELFEWMDNTGEDTLGMNWTKDVHLAAWQAMARAMAHASPEFEKRPWAFDFTVLPPN